MARKFEGVHLHKICKTLQNKIKAQMKTEQK